MRLHWRSVADVLHDFLLQPLRRDSSGSLPWD